MVKDDKSYWLRDVSAGCQRFFYFTGAKHLLENLQKNHVKLSRFSKCNDIFELASFSLGKRGIREKHREWKKHHDNEVGLLCLSRTWQNPAMWGHYADMGRGVCLVVDVKDGASQDVRYKSCRDKVKDNFEFPFFSQDELLFKDFCSRKSMHWAYEEEVRVFKEITDDNETGINFLTLGDDIKLVGIINGFQPRLGKKEIGGAIDGKTKFFQCRAAFQRFEIVCQQNAKKWHP